MVRTTKSLADMAEKLYEAEQAIRQNAASEMRERAAKLVEETRLHIEPGRSMKQEIASRIRNLPIETAHEDDDPDMTPVGPEVWKGTNWEEPDD